MNYKSNKIFTKCCASILAVSNIFSGVSATSEEKPKKAEDNQLSISKKELGGSILGASGLATFMTLFLSKVIFSANPTDTTEDIEAVKSMAIALTKTEEVLEKTDRKPKTIITEQELLKLCGAKSCKELLKRGEKGNGEICVDLNGVKYKYVMSNIENPSGIVTEKGNLSQKLYYCLYGCAKDSEADYLKKHGWENGVPFVMQLINLDGFFGVRSRCTVVREVAFKSDTIFSINRFDHRYPDAYPKFCISASSCNKSVVKKTLYAVGDNENDYGSDKALLVVGYWQKQTS